MHLVIISLNLIWQFLSSIHFRSSSHSTLNKRLNRKFPSNYESSQLSYFVATSRVAQLENSCAKKSPATMTLTDPVQNNLFNHHALRKRNSAPWRVHLHVKNKRKDDVSFCYSTVLYMQRVPRYKFCFIFNEWRSMMLTERSECTEIHFVRITHDSLQHKIFLNYDFFLIIQSGLSDVYYFQLFDYRADKKLFRCKGITSKIVLNNVVWYLLN